MTGRRELARLAVGATIMNQVIKWSLLTLFLSLLIVGASFALKYYKISYPSITPQTAVNNVFDSQSATVNAQITKVSDASITINKNGQTAQLTLSPKVMIYKYQLNSQTATPSADLKSIEVGKNALIVLELINNQYQIVSISYLSDQ